MNKRAVYNDHKWKRIEKDNKSQIGDVLLNVKCIPNKSKHWKFYVNGMVKYVADHQELLLPNDAIQYQTKNLASHNSYLSYMSRDTAKNDGEITPSNHIWNYTNLKQYKGQDISTQFTTSNKARLNLCELDKVRKIHENSHIWSIVISEKDLKMKDIMFQNQHKIVDRVIRSLFHFPVDATFAFHGNTEHPHIHIMVYQPEVMQQKHVMKKWLLEKRNIVAAKKSYSYFLMNNKNYFQELLDEKSKLRQSYDGEILQRIMQKQFVELLEVLATDKIPLLNEDGAPMYRKNGEPIYQMKFQFNRINEECRKKVLDLKDFVLNLETNNQEINELQSHYKKFRGIGSNLIEKEFTKLPNHKKDSLIQKTNELFDEADEKMCQQILKTAKEFYLQNKSVLSNSNDNFNENNQPKAVKHSQIAPAIFKLFVNNSSQNFNDMYKKIGFDNNLNKNLIVLKELIKKVENESKQRS